MSYSVRFSPQGSRCLYWNGTLVATNLATPSCVDYAKKRHVAYREAFAWHKSMPKTSPEDAWKRLRGFLDQYELKRSHLYPIMRRVLGRKRDLRDGRQLNLLQAAEVAVRHVLGPLLEPMSESEKPRLVLLPGGKH